MTKEEMNFLTNRKLEIKPYLLKDNRIIYVLENELIEHLFELKDINTKTISGNMIFYIDVLYKEFGFKDTVRMNNFDF